MSLRHLSKRERRRIARLGGQATAVKRRAAAGALPLPYAGSFLAFLNAAGRGGATRAAWQAFWRAADGLALTGTELDAFRKHTGRATPPSAPAREAWVLAGRRSGKSENVTARATHRVISRDWSSVLSAGERGVVPIIAPDRDQARHTLGFLKGLAQHPLVKPYVERVLRDSVDFTTGATVRVATASWRSARGFTFLDVILEESAFYRSDDSANPDVELLAAVRPALLTVPDARVYGISSPYSRSGILFDAWRKHWGKDASDVLVWNGSTVAMNPTVNEAEVERAFEDDPAVAGAEYGRDGLVTFRQDVEAFLSREAVDAVVVPERRELPRVAGVRYVAFVDPSGGSQDSMTLAIAHAESGVSVLDCVREVRAPFSPESVVAEFATVLTGYGLSRVTGDRYAGEWPRERFREHGITCEPSERTKSELYVEALPIINAQRCELLDVPRLVAQLVGLERHTGRGTGRDTVDHARGAHDDVANAACGALVLAVGGSGGRKRIVFR